MRELIPWNRKNENGGGIANWDSWENQFARIRDDLNALAGRVFGERPISQRGLMDGNWGWSIDMEETDHEFIVYAEALVSKPTTLTFRYLEIL